MKKATLFLFVLLVGTMAIFAQTAQKKEGISSTQNSVTKTVILRQTEFLETGKIKGISIGVVHSTDLINNTKTSAIGFRDGLTIITLDNAEVSSLIKIIKIMQEFFFKTTPKNYIKIEFESKNGLEVFCLPVTNEQWKAYFKPGKGVYEWSQEEFAELLILLEKAKTMLQ